MSENTKMIEGNLLIRASAGTGKTFALATRFIRLMLFDHVEPERIVALTFSRSAAQEIYTKLLERLWKAAEDADGAEEEHQNLIDRLPAEKIDEVEAKGIKWVPDTFAELLRKVVAVQHLGAIATLDSFILRLVGNFPLEMGFQNALEVLDPEGERDEVDRAARAILGRSQDVDGFAMAFRSAKKGSFSRMCAKALGEMMEREGWRKFILEHPECREWNVQTMSDALGLGEFAGFMDVSETETAKVRDEVNDKTSRKWLDKFLEYLVSVKPGDDPIPGKSRTIPVEFARAVVRHPETPTVEHETRHRDGLVEVTECVFTPNIFKAARADLIRLADAYFRHQLEIVEAKIRLFGIIEKEYDAATRRAGKLTFRDFTNAAKDNSKIELENLRFRFDAKLDHWALDEFQDTSEVQWACLKDLVASAASGGGSKSRSVIAVGDLKQSIYTWRGGDDKPFEEMMSWPWFGTDKRSGEVYGNIENSETSYRYGKHIADFINRVFGPDNIRNGGLIPKARSAAVERWLAGDCWLEHVPQYNADGSPKVLDYVKVVGARLAEDSDVDDEIMPALYSEVASVWKAREDADSTDSVGILVRRNEDGTKIAEYLRKKGIPVVWEGVNAVSDVPSVQGVLQLLKLAEHPEDTFAWTTVNTLLPICEILMPDVRSAAAASAKMADILSRQGLARTLKDVCGALCREENGLDGLSRSRLRALVRLGVEYERRKASDFGVDGFSRFVAAAGKRESAASANAVRILSIHRSKGLTLDRVFVPLFEGDKSSIVEPSTFSALFGKGREWVLPHLSADVAVLNGQTNAVLDEQRDARLLEHLRLYYVALTRSRKALYVLFSQEEHRGLLFRDIITKAVDGFAKRPIENGTLLFEDGELPAFRKCEKKTVDRPVWRHDASDARIQRRSPSGLSHGLAGVPGSMPPSADILFAGGYGSAARHGVEVHASYAKIEWAEADMPIQLPVGFMSAFMRPSGNAVAWRERSYELLIGNCWETGQFDRVVFTGEEGNRSATIYDFKTNAREPGESDAEFAERMRSLYSPQMDAYRNALNRLTGIPVGRIKTELLLVASGQAVVT